MNGRDDFASPLIFAFPIALALSNGCAWAQNPPSGAAPTGWQVRPALTVSEHYSDNISLAPKGAERSELTTRVSPSVSVSANSARLKLNATYAPELLHRLDQGTTDFSHFLNATGTAEVLARAFFVDARANISQQNRSLLGPQAQSNINTTRNRTSVRSWAISPYLRHNFGANAIGELRYTHDEVDFGGNAGGLSSSEQDRLDAKLYSGPAYKLMTWSLSASKASINYPQRGQKVEPESISANIGRLVTPELRLNANIGYEDSGYPSSGSQELKGKFWSVGPEWTPTERTRISGSIGRRYFGPWRTFHLDHRSRLTVWGIDYSESVTTSRFESASPLARFFDAALASDPRFQNPIVRAAAVRELLSLLNEPLSFLTDSLFLDKRLQLTFGIEGARNTVRSSIFTSDRQSLTTIVGGSGGDFGLSRNTKQQGVSVTWTYRLSETSASNLTLSSTRNSFGGLGRVDRLNAIRWSLSKDFDPRMTGTLAVTRLRNDSDVTTSSYTEHSLAATLGMKF